MITKKTAWLPDSTWLRGPDLNRRPSGYEPDELPLLHPAMLSDLSIQGATKRPSD